MTMKILMCDDETDFLRVAKVTLEARGHEVVTATDAQTAIELFDCHRDHDGEWDLVVTDIVMPGDSGFFLAGHARAKGYEGRLAVLTNTDAEESNLAKVGAEYWFKMDAMAKLVDLVEGGAHE